MAKQMMLQAKNAVVTGSTHGIGRAIAELLAREGANVVVNARGSGTDGPGTNYEEIDAVVEAIRSTGGNAVGVAGSVNDPKVAEKLVQTCVDDYGSIDILVNNAGVLGMGNVDTCEQKHWHDVIDINVNGTFYCAQYASRFMKAQRHGRIINCGSDASDGCLGGSCYATSKAAVIGLTRAMARDLGMYGITSNCYNPCARTRMSDQDDGGYFQRMCQNFLDRKFWTPEYYEQTMNMGDPDGIAPLVAYLSSDEAHYINGRIFSVESGRISVLHEPTAQASLHRDYRGDGPWEVPQLHEAMRNEMGRYLSNPWHKESEEEIQRIESAMDDFFK